MPVADLNVSIGVKNPAFRLRPLDDLFIRNGMNLAWYPAQGCMCWGEMLNREAESGSPDPDCTLCHGAGFLYSEKLLCSGVFFAKMSHQTVFTEAGLTFNGEITLTVPRLPGLTRLYNDLGFRDIIVPTDMRLESPFHVRSGADELPYPPTEVFQISWAGHVFDPATDYQIHGRRILWVGNAPPANTIYLVRFAYCPIYSVMDSLAVVRAYGARQFPKSFHLEEDISLGDLAIFSPAEVGRD